MSLHTVGVAVAVTAKNGTFGRASRKDPSFLDRKKTVCENSMSYNEGRIL